MPDTLRHLLASAISDPDTAGAVLAAIGTDSHTAHLDAEQLAAAVEGERDPHALAHMLGCARCGERYAEIAELERVSLFAARSEQPLRPELDAASAPRVVFATIRTLAGGAMEVSAGTGAARIQPALAVRAERGLEAVSLRDCPVSPRLEIAIVPEPDPKRFSLLVRWLGDDDGGLVARATAGGRTLAEMEIDEGSALLANLRKSDVRIDVQSAAGIIAVGWLRVEAAG